MVSPEAYRSRTEHIMPILITLDAGDHRLKTDLHTALDHAIVHDCDFAGLEYAIDLDVDAATSVDGAADILGGQIMSMIRNLRDS